MESLDLSSLQKAVDALEASLHVVSDLSWFNQQSLAVRNTLVSGVIQNFECVYELSIKMLRRQLEKEASTPSEIDQADFKTLLRTGAEKGCIDDVEVWFAYRLMRNITAHTYDNEKAQQVYQGTVEFLKDAHHLLNALMQRSHG